jgi:predicted lipid carrier protein YhbT
MEHFQPALDPRKQELLEARFLGTRVRDVILSVFCFVKTGCRISSVAALLN